jgi:hypothetical protein
VWRFSYVIVACVATLSGISPSATAAVSIEEAAALATTLTPLGAERAGNASGTIPEWIGGYRAVDSAYRPGVPRSDPFRAEKPLFSITRANLGTYEPVLPEGAKALFAKYPGYRMDVYPSHRTAAAPQWVYENIARNATRSRAAAAGIAYGIEGAIGGIPFPIPKNGHEVVWNHLLAFWGPARETHLSNYVVTPGGTLSLATSYREIADFPYYYPNATPSSISGYYFKSLRFHDGPPAKAGQGYLAWQPIDTDRYKFASWRILPLEHRVRKGPSLSYDTPDTDAEGYQNLDEYYVFFGGPDRYDFRIAGKREMIVPYNNNRFYTLPVGDVAGPSHINPDSLRYEWHRVWVIEGRLAPGKRHVSPRRRLYIDEDTWLAVYSDSWDNRDRLWKFGQGTMYLMPDLPAVIIGTQFVYDLQLGGYVLGFAFNGEREHYKLTAPHPEGIFTQAGFAAQAVR